MKTLQRFLMGLGSLLLLAVALQLFVPKAAHAVVSTLVTVANTPSNPVYTTDAVNSENLLQVTCILPDTSNDGGGFVSEQKLLHRSRRPTRLDRAGRRYLQHPDRYRHRQRLALCRLHNSAPASLDLGEWNYGPKFLHI